MGACVVSVIGRFGRVAAAVGAAVALAGCMDVTAVLTVAPDATATGTYEVALDREIAGAAGIGSLDDFQQAVGEGDLALPDGSSLSFREDGDAYVMAATFVDVPLQEDDLSSEVLADGRVRLTFRNLGSTDADSGSSMTGGSLSMTVTMPGRITVVDGFERVDDDTVTWSGALDDVVNAVVVSDPGGSGSSDGPPVLPIVLGALLVLAMVVGLVRERRSA